MATKVEKRHVRKQKNLEAIGIDPVEEKEKNPAKWGRKNRKEDSLWNSELFRWGLFFLEILLLIFIFSFDHF